MRGPLLWVGGVTGSLLAHVAAFGFLNLSVQPDPTPTQPKPETKLAMDAYQVDRQKAEEKAADSETAPEKQAQGEGVDAGAIPQSKAEATAPEVTQTQAIQPVATPSKPVTANAVKAPASEAKTAALTQTTPKAQSLKATTAAPVKIASTQATTAPLKATDALPVTHTSASLKTNPIATLTPKTAKVSQAKTPALAMLQLDTPSAPAAPTKPDAPTVAPEIVETETTEAQIPDAQDATSEETTGDQAPIIKAPTEDANEPPLPSTFAKADTAWNFGDRIVTDPTALATIQAFMSPEALSDSTSNAGRARDGLESLLTSIDCARLSVTFIPETGALELRGHVPDNALRAPILQTLQDQIGEGITVTDNMRHLPKPQCGALSGIADVGLPQSTDQLTNKRLIGDNAQAVEFTYSEGQGLGFDMTAPDYAAVVYVDYFDAGGQVIHLVPNDVVPLTSYTPAQVVGIERGDGPRLNITIGPPFGQEIAVAFAASKPLYDGTRPIIEPAEPYLEFLKSKVSEARETDPDFKGEWVYFFITTQPATQ